MSPFRLLLVAGCTSLLGVHDLRAAEGGAGRPNVIFVLIDDMGWGDLSCFGNRQADTATIDRLASEGIRFSQFYVNAPICSPSRCSLTTGQYPERWRITSFLSHRADNNWRGIAQWLDPRATTLARILHDNGYATGHFGKWHLGGQRDVDDAPPISAYGFEESLTNFEGMGAKLLPLTQKPGQAEPGRIWADAERLGGPVTWMPRSTITTGYVDAAVEFIEQAAGQGKPFYVNVWPDDVHTPLWPPVEKWGDGSRGTLYRAVLEALDHQLGRLFDFVRGSPELADNTLIVICSDNGPEAGAGSAGPFRGTKATLYEGGIRSPLIVWGPGLVETDAHGTHNERSVCSAMDLVPSLLEITGVSVPADATFDGVNLAPVLLGRSEASRSLPLFWRRPPDRKTAYGSAPLPDLAAREGNWKLLCNYDGSQAELYDLSKDLGETTDLAEQYPRVAKELTAAVVRWHEALPADQGPELAGRPNVLMLLVDDLKPALHCYGDPVAKTPNIDRLASRGMRFDLAYCNQAVCAPSRFTLFLGSHSTSTGLYGLGSQLRRRLPGAVTLPQYFARHGYRTESLGKVFHVGHGNEGDPQSFSVVPFHDKVIEYADPESVAAGQLTREQAYFTNQRLGQIRSLPRGPAYESPDVADDAYADGRVADEAIRRLEEARVRRERDGTPFFIVAGFARPHLPFSSPRKYWELYDPAHLPGAGADGPPRDAPEVAGKTNGELANYEPVPESGQVGGDLGRQLTWGYYASVSYVDAQIGKVLDELDRLELAQSTIVVLWGDHGFHLGDHGYWTKHTNYEQANRIPLVVAAPGVAKPGSATRQLAESADLFPTLAELAGLPDCRRSLAETSDAPDRGMRTQPIDGVSLVPVLRDREARVRDHAFHAYPKARMGRAIRTERFRLIEWRNPNEPAESAEIELYDYDTDPRETRNLAASLPQVVADLRAVLARYPEPVDPNEE
jgi:arylsulfatase A-like enzyme